MTELSDRLREAVSTQGILAAALPDAVSRGERQFSLPPTDAELTQWASSLRATCPHFFPPPPSPVAPDAEGTPPGVPPSVWKSMAPSSKLAWARAHGYGSKPVERRPQSLDVSPEQAVAFAKMSPAERLTAFRRMRQDQGKGEADAR
jgi:hypothetical protein